MCVLLFKQEDGALPMRNFYDLPENTVDVLFLGSSHMGMNLSTDILWNKYGIAGYKCWGSVQPIWNTYYYLKECLKYQRPKVIVMDVHGATFSYDYPDFVIQLKNTIGMRFSRNKIDAVLTSSRQDQWGNLLLGLPTYHTRYNELTETDFQYFPWNRHQDITVLVNQNLDTLFEFDIMDKDQTSGIEPLAEKEEKFFRMIIELCQEENIPLELVASPYQIGEIEQKRYRAIRQVVSEYEDINFTNFNEVYRDYGIDTHKDFLDPGHFNMYGVPKYTDAIAQILTAKYDLMDHRSDENHIWNQIKKADITPVYELEHIYHGDGKRNYVDTGKKLLDNIMDSWTILADFTVPPFTDFDRIILSCYDETPDHYQGILVTIDDYGKLAVMFSSFEDIKSEKLEENSRVRLAIVKNEKRIDVYLNGKFLGTHKLENLAKYSGNLLVGCQENQDGFFFRFSKPVVYDLQVFDSILSETDIRNWEPRNLPEPPEKQYLSDEEVNDECIYRMDYEYSGDGQELYTDTGVKLYQDQDNSWTLLSQIDPRIDKGDTVYFSAFVEDVNNYRGLLVRRLDVGKLNIAYGNNSQITIDIPTDEPSILAIVKDSFSYTVYLNGEIIVDGDNSPCDVSDLNLLIGSQVDSDGNLFRFSGTTVYNLEIYNGLMSSEDILSWKPEPMPEAPKPIPSDVRYYLENSFAGNGRNVALDTGIQLYDVADKNWSLHLVIDYDKEGLGTALSCFAEDPTNYRGFLVRQLDETTYDLTLGSSHTTLTVGWDPVVIIDVIKEGYHYTVYMNGEKKFETDAVCKSWDGTLIIDAERLLNGSLFRYSNQKVRKLEITEEIPDESEILQKCAEENIKEYFKK